MKKANTDISKESSPKNKKSKFRVRSCNITFQKNSDVEGRGCKYASNWRALHEVVFEALGLTKEEQIEVYQQVTFLFNKRLVKTRSV